MKSLILIIITHCVSYITIAQNNRPQEPKEPFNYNVEAVQFTNSTANNIKLAGTLSTPKDLETYPVAILISGSGQQNRDEEISGHKPFLVLADYLTNHGIAVLRYDDRGAGDSEGDFSSSTTFDFASDVEAAINYLKSRNDIDNQHIGLIGHSEGGLIAAIVASKNKDVSFVISLAGTGVTGAKVLESQSWEIAKQMGADEETLEFNRKITRFVYDAIESETDKERIKLAIRDSLNAFKKENKDSPYAVYLNDALIINLMTIVDNDWMLTFIRTDPQTYYEKVTCPVLALNGGTDMQVLPKLNLDAIEVSLQKANNNDVTIKSLEGLNHLFQSSSSGNPNEYGTIEETFSPLALNIIKDWILERF